VPAASTDPELRLQPTGSGSLCRAVLATLPTWFGMDEANEDFARLAETTPTVVASLGGEDVGLLTLVTHTPYAAEVHLMAVRPEHHRRGIGRRMLVDAEEHLRAWGVEYLQVKTLAESHPDPGYVLTRAFYAAMGFRPLEVFPDLWDPSNPALQLVKRL
jgi:GNAT superfamily N-acetyltransferase